MATQNHGAAAGSRSPAAAFESTQVANVGQIDSTAISKLKDWLIVPGIGVGPVTARSTEADLKATLGAAEVLRDSVFWFEGEYRPATVLFPKDSLRRLSIVWKDEERWSKPQRVELEGRHSLWHTADGITLGTTVEDLEHLNGKPFRITSADYDYAGLAWSWEDGALQMKLKFLELWLEPQFHSEVPHPYSSDRTARAARPTVGRMYAYFPD